MSLHTAEKNNSYNKSPKFAELNSNSKAACVDVYCVQSTNVDVSLRYCYEQLLDTDERARLNHLIGKRTKEEFLITRATVRCVLSRYAEVSPLAWRFTSSISGRPEIMWLPEQPAVYELQFNVSHSDGLIACIVSTVAKVGIDVEAKNHSQDFWRLANRFLSVYERTTLKALPASQQYEQFLRYWTLKEAYLKAKGLGLPRTLDSFWFVLEPCKKVRLVDRTCENTSHWHFEHHAYSRYHMMATAVVSDTTLPPTISVHDFVPLQD